jgi:hypothetical protein
MALVFAALLLVSPAPQGYGSVQSFLAGMMVAAAFFLWERRGFRELLSRHEAEIQAAKRGAQSN